ncbi:hypothetical protein EZV73_26485 [Acidaminobacter sp. JC074]|uniref:ATP-binding protein n=1 Tax=Acidaminobacter sp. JC074 TaxID=2530199 RepID=UPI001F0EFD44|nr:SbcC/MukB-like Walker B domain-containing protein [Acidaminobacter sp. JC074]MCH4891154.1 hypothetical protein [Acidaminobacter sp. JC074]
MKHIRRMLLLNWHYIHKELIEFESINFLTGKNASGKSTLIDAMQLLLLGDTSGHYFNKAANDKSKRTLLGYLKGELSDNDTTFNYLRNKDFSSHLVMEVFDDEIKKYFLIGFIADVVGDKFDHKFYIADTSIPDDLFIKDKYVKSRQEVKSYFRNHNIKHTFYDTNTLYRDNLRFKMGQINSKYFSLFKKAVPFSPITDIKKFITEFICDANSHVDISDMKDNIRHYESLGSQVDEIEKMVKDLEVIENIYGEYVSEVSKKYLYQFLIDYSEFKNNEDLLSDCNLQIGDLEASTKKVQALIRDKETEIETLDLKITEKNIQLTEYEPFKLEQEYKREINAHKNEISKLDESIQKVKDRLLSRLIQWKAGLSSDYKDLTLDIDQALAKLKDNDLDFDIPIVADKLSRVKDDLTSKYHDLRILQVNREKEIILHKKVIENLKSGIKDYNPSITRLRDLIQVSLKSKYNKDIPVDILCELIEIKNPRWKDAIEGYLNTQKFYLIVEPKYYLDALKIYDDFKFKHAIYGVGLVDIEKIMNLNLKVKSPSLAEEIEASNKYARAYIDYLLGGVIKCMDVSEIRNHKISITDTCMLYKNYVARQLNPSSYKVPYIGRQAVKNQLELRQEALKDLQEVYSSAKEDLSYLGKMVNLKVIDDELIEDFDKSSFDLDTIGELSQAIKDLEDKLSKIDMSSILLLQNEIQDLQLKRGIIDKEIRSLDGKNIADKHELERLNTHELPRLENQTHISSQKVYDSYDADYIENTGLKRFDQELDRLLYARKIIENFSRMLSGSINKVHELESDLHIARSSFDKDYLRDFGPFAENNDEYTAFLNKLKDTELPSFKKQIDSAKEKAMQEFQDDFISKLKSNIDDVTGQIKELNTVLKNPKFGKDKYKFSIKPNAYYRKYYDMIMDKTLMEGYSLFSHDFQMKYKDVIDELFKQIVDVGEGGLSLDEREEMEKNILKYTDYRTYLDFDLVVTNALGEEQHLSKMISKKSGGETQTPFYISVLASFSKIYRIHHPRNNNTMRMIIFDEAFSKMDHERIEESLKLLREMNFQALISAPTEKIANIAPHADKTLCVLRSDHMAAIREYDIVKDSIQ